ncbi:MAG: AAA family ATPase [Pseudomonadota bacterium]
MTKEPLLACVMSVQVADSKPDCIPGLERVAVSRGGRVIQISSLGFFGIFESASVAVQVSIALARFAAYGSDSPINVGIDAGQLHMAGAQCTGDAVNEASRLRDSTTDSEQIVISPGVRRFVLSEETLPSLNRREDGSYVVEWRTDKRGAVLPRFLAINDQVIVGRTNALRTLKLRSSELSGASLVTVIGEAGIGKTRLLSEFAIFAANQGALVLGGQEHEGLGQPYASLHECLSQWLEQIDNVAFQSMGSIAHLAKIVPSISDQLYGLKVVDVQDAETERRRLSKALAEWLASVAQKRPVILILDSMHWASDSTFKILEGMLHYLQDAASVSLVLASRDTDKRTYRLSKLAGERWGDGRTSNIVLRNLTKSDIQAFYETSLSEDLVDLIHLTTRGHPLHLVNLMDFVAKGQDLPKSVEKALQGRIKELPGNSLAVLEACAVLGPRFTARVIADIHPQRVEVFEALDRATESGLIKLVDPVRLGYQFAHSLIRSYIKRGIGAARGANLHVRAADALQLPQNQELASPADLARLYAGAASLGYQSEATSWAEKAADTALMQHANEEARDMYQMALELQTDPATHAACRLQLGFGIALARAGDSRSQDLLWEAADRAESLGDGILMARAMLATYRLAFSRAREVDKEAVGRLRRALAMIPKDETALITRITALLAVELAWEDDRSLALEASDQAMEMSRSESEEVQAEVRARRLWVYFHPTQERVKETEELLALVEASENPVLAFEAAGHAVFTAIRAGSRSMLERYRESMRVAARAIDDPIVKSMYYLREANVALLESRYTDSLTLAQRRLNLTKKIGQVQGEQAYRVQSFWVAYETVSVADLSVLLDKLISTLPSEFLDQQALGAHVACECGRLELIESLIEPFADFAFAHDQIFLQLNCLLVEPAIAVGQKQMLAALEANLEPHQSDHANTVFSSMGPVARYLALIRLYQREFGRGVELLRESIELARRLHSKFWATRGMIDLASVTPDRRERHELVDQIRHQSNQHGWSRLSERIDQIKG